MNADRANYPKSFISHATCREEDGYLMLVVPEGTRLYHGSQNLPVTFSESGTTAIADIPWDMTCFPDEYHAPSFGFPFPFSLKRSIAVFDLMNRWNLDKYRESAACGGWALC